MPQAQPHSAIRREWVPVFGCAETGMTAFGDQPPLVPDAPPPYLCTRRVMLWLSSKAIYPRDLNFFEGICPCLVPWGQALRSPPG